jgi:hypothetical protein
MPPVPGQRLQTLRKAAQACRDTLGRTGRWVELQDCDEVLVGGDLHGNLDNFRQLLQNADLAHHPRRHFVLQEAIHGPHRYPNGGDKSHQLLELVAALKCQFPQRFHFLLGNHELAQTTGRAVGKFDENLNQLFLLGVEFAHGDEADRVFAAYQELLAIVPLALRSANRILFSHALPSFEHLADFRLQSLLREPSDEADLLPGGAIYALVWDRDVRPETTSLFLEKVDADWLISGHLPCEQGYEIHGERHLILDSLGSPGAYALLPASRPLEPGELSRCVRLLSD